MASFSSGSITSDPEDFFSPISIDVGLRAALFNNPNTFGKQLIRFDQFCDVIDLGLDRYMDPADCGQCEEVSEQLFIAIVVALVAFVPTIATDILRIYATFDVNCQKVWASFLSLFTLAGCVLTYVQYTYTCLDSFHDESVAFTKTGIMVPPGSPFEAVVVSFDWKVGNGMICLFAGFGLKVIDFICNCCNITF